jgi:hypothetical protein
MPKKSALGNIYIDILKPQSQKQKAAIQGLNWLLSAGRYLIIFVELIVLGAFLTRFKLDADIAATKEAINKQIPFIKQQNPQELLIRKTQFQLATIKDIKFNSIDYLIILKRISDQTPAGIVLDNVGVTNDEGKVLVKMAGTAKNNSELSTLIRALKKDGSFPDANITSIEFDSGTLNFTINSTYKNPGSKNL